MLQFEYNPLIKGFSYIKDATKNGIHPYISNKTKNQISRGTERWRARKCDLKTSSRKRDKRSDSRLQIWTPPNASINRVDRVCRRAGYQIESGWYDTTARSGALVLYQTPVWYSIIARGRRRKYPYYTVLYRLKYRYYTYYTYVTPSRSSASSEIMHKGMSHQAKRTSNHKKYNLSDTSV